MAEIFTRDAAQTVANDIKVTGTTVDSTKRALDVAVLSSINSTKLDTIISLLGDILVALGSAPTTSNLLLEDGFAILLENGDNLLLE